VLENKLKNASEPAISALHKANIKTVMVTGKRANFRMEASKQLGDHPLTAINVAKQCNLIPKKHRIFLAELSRKGIE